jgi:muramidase (phage lysozyme)
MVWVCICTGQDKISIIKVKSSHDLINNISKGKLPNTVGKLSNTVGKLSNTVGKLSNTVRKLSNTGASWVYL